MEREEHNKTGKNITRDKDVNKEDNAKNIHDKAAHTAMSMIWKWLTTKHIHSTCSLACLSFSDEVKEPYTWDNGK